MLLTLTNTGAGPEVMTNPRTAWSDVLEPGAPFDLEQDIGGVLIIGDKQSVREQVGQATAVLETVARKAREAIANRKLGKIDVGQVEHVSAKIQNRGPNSVRVILGDGANDTTVAPGATVPVSAAGYRAVPRQRAAAQQPAPADRAARCVLPA